MRYNTVNKGMGGAQEVACGSELLLLVALASVWRMEEAREAVLEVEHHLSSLGQCSKDGGGMRGGIWSGIWGRNERQHVE
jgi:hypothetical protein